MSRTNSQKMKLPSCFSMPRVLASVLPVVVCIVCFHWAANGGSPFSLEADVQWDLVGAEKQLLDKVHGQASAVQQLLDSLQWTQQNADHLNPTNGSFIKVIFLLGGPGVGKTEAVKLIFNNVKCQFRGMWATFPCEMNRITRPPSNDSYISQIYTDSTSMLKYHGTLFNTLELELTGFKDEHAESFAALENAIAAHADVLHRRAFLVSGPVMTKGQLKSLTPTQYDQLLDRYALQIAKAMTRHAKRVDFTIIKFRKLKPLDMVMYMLRKSNADEHILTQMMCDLWEKQFNTEGCPFLDIEEEL